MTNKPMEPRSMSEQCEALRAAWSDFVRLLLEEAGVFRLFQKIAGKR
jgi:hypothetical protein